MNAFTPHLPTVPTVGVSLRDLSVADILDAVPGITQERANAVRCAIGYIGSNADSQDIDDWSARRRITVPAYVVWGDLKALRAGVAS
jgi:hypothetical protein